MSHLRPNSSKRLGRLSQVTATSRQQFQNILLARRAGTAGDHLISRMFQSCLCARPPPSKVLALGARNIHERAAAAAAGIFCRGSLVSTVALPLHLPSKAEHLCQRVLLIVVVCPPLPLRFMPSLAAVRYRLLLGDGRLFLALAETKRRKGQAEPPVGEPRFRDGPPIRSHHQLSAASRTNWL